tara:strand:+ start:120 stop:473 length:354 start_codon:yes stop_codon:yes gene_type:complete
MIGKCYTCDAKVDVYLDYDMTCGADYCANCLLANLTWDESTSGTYHFNKATNVRLIQLRLIATRMQGFNKSCLEWNERYGKPYGLEHKVFPKNVVREEVHMNPNWMPELHEVCHLVG